MHPKEEIERLKKLVNYHNNLYYNLDNPVLSDTQYDELYKQLIKLRKERLNLIRELEKEKCRM